LIPARILAKIFDVISMLSWIFDAFSFVVRIFDAIIRIDPFEDI
jgi:hypothetical protein